MSDNKKATNSLLKGMQYLIKEEINKAPIDQTLTGVIKNVKENNLYDVLIGGKLYSNIPSIFKGFSINDTVKIKVPQNQFSQMYISGKYNMEVKGGGETSAVTSVNGQTGDVIINVPTKTSELNNDSNFVSDENYIHTDNNFTNDEKQTVLNSKEHIINKNNPHNVNKNQVGLGNVPNVITNDQTPTWSIATTLTNIVSGEKLTVIMGKISKAISDIILHIGNRNNPHNVTKTQIGLENVENKSSATIRGELTRENVTNALGYVPPSTDTKYGVATSSQLGLIKSGTDIIVDSNGNVSVVDNSHNHTIDNIAGLQNNLDNKESKFSKNTAFNKNFETDIKNIKENGVISVGVLPTVARADHIHPLQKNVSGNAGSATKLETPRKIAGSLFDGTKDISIDYSNLLNKPTIPIVNNGVLTIQKNGVNISTFSANQGINSIANVEVPTKTSELLNDSGFKTTDNNTTYSLSKNGSEIILTGSDGKTSKVIDNDTKYTLNSFGVIATANELNKLKGCVATTAELNYLSGVSSNLQTQLNNKAPINHNHNYLPLSGGTMQGAIKFPNSTALPNHNNLQYICGITGFSEGGVLGWSSASNIKVGYANKADSAKASDVYSWAKQPNKPTYSYNELTDKPTIPSGIQVIDNLNSSSATASLSANQGRILKDRVDKKVVVSKSQPSGQQVGDTWYQIL